MGNVYVDGNVSIIEELTISNNVYADKDLEVMGNVYMDGNVVAYKDFTLTGNAYVNGNVNITEELTISNNVYADKDLEVVGNVYVDGNVVAYKDFTLTGNAYVSGNVNIIEELTISNNVYADKDLEVVGNVYVDGNVVAYKDLLVTGNIYVTGNALGTTHINAKSGQHIRLSVGASEKARMTSDGDFYVNTDTLYVDASESRIGIKTTSPGQSLDVRGDANVGVLTTTSGTVTDATQSTSKDTGVLVLTQGGLGVEANIHSTNVFAASHIAVGTSATSNTFDVRGTANVGALVATSTHISDSTTSVSKTSGALQVTGGTGIQGTLYAADTTLDSVQTLNMSTGTVPLTDAAKKLINSLITQDTEGNISISGNVEITGNISVLGNSFSIKSSDLIINDRIIDIANNNVSTTLDVGILMEHPNKNIFIGHHTSPHDHFSIGYTDAGYSADQVEWTGTDHITANVWGHLITQNTVTVQYGNVYIVDGGLGIGIGDGENDDVPDSKLYVTGNAHFTSNISTASNVLITGIAAATSKTTGALQVTGGVGVGGEYHATDATLRCGAIVYSNRYNPSTTKDTGAIIVTTGGVVLNLNLHKFLRFHIGCTTATQTF